MAMDVIWQQASAANPGGAYDILLARSTDGETFQKFTMDSAPTAAANTGQIAADAKGNVYVVWLGSAGSGGDVLINGDSQGITTPPPFNLAQVSATVTPVSATISAGGAASFTVLAAIDQHGAWIGDAGVRRRAGGSELRVHARVRQLEREWERDGDAEGQRFREAGYDGGAAGAGRARRRRSGRPRREPHGCGPSGSWSS